MSHGGTRTAEAGAGSSTSALAVLVFAGVVLLFGGVLDEGPAPDARPARSSETVSASASPSQETEPRRRAGPLLTESMRGRLRIPALGVSAPVVPVAAPERVLWPPDDPGVLGWWKDGAAPGARRGSALVTGHTVSSGGGALDELERLEVGDRVVFSSERGRLRYRVTRVRTYPKQTISQDAEQLFSQDVPGRLVIITCEDWTGEVYLSNVVVTARPL